MADTPVYNISGTYNRNDKPEALELLFMESLLHIIHVAGELKIKTEIISNIYLFI